MLTFNRAKKMTVAATILAGVGGFAGLQVHAFTLDPCGETTLAFCNGECRGFADGCYQDTQGLSCFCTWGTVTCTLQGHCFS